MVELKIYTLKGVKTNDDYIEVDYVAISLDKITKLINDLKFRDVDVYSNYCNYLFSIVNGKHLIKEIY